MKTKTPEKLIKYLDNEIEVIALRIVKNAYVEPVVHHRGIAWVHYAYKIILMRMLLYINMFLYLKYSN